MDIRYVVSVVANFMAIGALILYGMRFFGEYHATGRWAKNVTNLLAGVGMIVLAAALMLTPRNTEVLMRIASTDAPKVFLGISSGLLLAAIAAFGVITYAKPLRLWHERKLERDLKGDLPKIP
jgi:hypothetical protein